MARSEKREVSEHGSDLGSGPSLASPRRTSVAPSRRGARVRWVALGALGLIGLAGATLLRETPSSSSSGAGASPSVDRANSAAPTLTHDADVDTLRLFFLAETRGNLVPCRCPDQPWGGLDRRTGFLEQAAADPRALIVDAGGFLPEGEVPLRSGRESARRLMALLLDAASQGRIAAIALDPGHLEFLQRIVPDEAASADDVLLEAVRGEFRVVPWGTLDVAILALAESLTDAEISRAAKEAREAADVLIVLARTSVDYARVAELSAADVLVLSDGARPAAPLRHGSTWIVGAGAHGREVGEMRLMVHTPDNSHASTASGSESKSRLEMARYTLHPMDETVEADSAVGDRVRQLLDELGPGWEALVMPAE